MTFFSSDGQSDYRVLGWRWRGERMYVALGNAHCFVDTRKKSRFISALSNMSFAYTVSQILLSRSNIRRMLAFGLGSGSGLTQQLLLFPELVITVVEIDPVIIRLARQYFPAIKMYEKAGRLIIIEADAFEYMKQDNLRELIGDACFQDITSDDPATTNAFLEPVYRCYEECGGDFDIVYNIQLMEHADVSKEARTAFFEERQLPYYEYKLEYSKATDVAGISNIVFSTIKKEAINAEHLKNLPPRERAAYLKLARRHLGVQAIEL